MKLSKNEVHVWYFNVADFSRDIEFYKSHLSKEEIFRSNKFKFEKDRILNIMARSSLRILSALYLDSAANAIEFKYGPYGKPDYNFTTKLKFNISHSGKLVTLAFVKSTEIGIDIEMVKTDFDVLNLAENFFSDLEIAKLQDTEQEDLYKAFYRCWTRKESFIKAKGSGLSFPLASFSVSIDKKAELLKTEWNPLEKEEWSIFAFEPTSGYVGAVSVPSAVQKVRYRKWDGAI